MAKHEYTNKDLHSRFNREYDGNKIDWTTCDWCKSDKGQWADETNNENGHECNAVLCRRCAIALMKGEELRYSSYANYEPSEDKE